MGTEKKLWTKRLSRFRGRLKDGMGGSGKIARWRNWTGIAGRLGGTVNSACLGKRSVNKAYPHRMK